MKGLVTLAVIGVIVGFGFYALSGYTLAADHGEFVAFVCGSIAGGPLKIQIVVEGPMVRHDPPRSHPETLQPLWPEWIDEHFTLTTKAGEPVPLKRQHHGNLMPSGKAGTPDSYLEGVWPAVGGYVVEFVPKLSEGKRYRAEFAVQEDGRPYERAVLALVK